MATTPRRTNAALALEGVSVGDAFGECFFSAPRECLRNRELPSPPWVWTDDTHMALSIVETLQAHGEIQQDTLAGAFARRFMAEPYRGYGKGAFALLSRIASGEDWRIAAPKLFGHGSYGNGAAMRAAPIGGFFSGDPSRAASEAQLSAAVTHAHPEGQAGAMAVAAAAALAAGGRLAGRALIQATLPYVPDGETRSRIATSLDIPAEDSTKPFACSGRAGRSPLQIPCRSACGAPRIASTTSKRRCGVPWPGWAIAIPPARS